MEFSDVFTKSGIWSVCVKTLPFLVLLFSVHYTLILFLFVIVALLSECVKVNVWSLHVYVPSFRSNGSDVMGLRY